jgi:nicotinate-nucleotide adenylyltransferase
MRIGIFGGSFDPIHQGHLIIAEQCREQAALDEIWFVPAATAPHKQGGAMATPKQRMEMVELAVAGHPQFVVKGMEIERGGASYTVDTLEEIKGAHPEANLFLILGGDSAEQMPTWKNPERICELALPLVYFRPGISADVESLRSLVAPDRFQAIEQAAIAPRVIDISSTDIRQRIAEGRSIRYLLPRSVEMFIQTQKIYRATLSD